MHSRILRGVAVLLLSLAAPASIGPAAQSRTIGGTNPPAIFTDPERRAKLATAFPEIDRQIAAFMERTHMPGAAWGIVIDGELAHVGVAGYRELDTKSPVDRGHRVSHCVDDQELHRAGDPQAARRRQAVARRPGREMRARAEGPRYPTTDSPRMTIRQLMSHATGFPEDNPWGDQQLVGDRRADVTDDAAAGIPFSNSPGVAYEYSNYGFAILGRIVTRVSGMPYRRVHR